VGHKGAKEQNMLQAPLITKSISKIKKDEKPKKTINLEKPSLIMKMHLQIEVA
jgi:hypothetical protein